MSTKQVIVVRKDLNMRKGKIAAQVAHAAMAFLTSRFAVDIIRPERYRVRVHNLPPVAIEWLESSFTKVVAGVDTEQELVDLIEAARAAGVEVFPVVDNGTTEFNGTPTLTCAAFGPDTVDRLNAITGDLNLL